MQVRRNPVATCDPAVELHSANGEEFVVLYMLIRFGTSGYASIRWALIEVLALRDRLALWSHTQSSGSIAAGRVKSHEHKRDFEKHL